MKKIPFILLLLISIFIQCKEKGSEEKKVQNVIEDNQYHETYTSDTITVEFDGGVKLLWDMINETIVEDSNYYTLKDSPIDKTVVNSISDTTNLHIPLCSKTGYLRKGDLAFIILWEIHPTVAHVGLERYFDTLESFPECKYPDGLFDYLEDNRDIIKERILEKYFDNAK